MKIVLKLPESLSEMVLFSPVLKYIKDKYKDAYIIAITSKYGRDIFLHDPHINEIWAIDKMGSRWKFFWYLNRKWKDVKVDHYFYFGGGHLASVWACLKRVPNRTGLYTGLFSYLFFNHLVRQEREFTEMHETEYNLNVLSSLGFQYHASEKKILETKLYIDPESAKRSLERFYQQILKTDENKNKKIIFLHPFARYMHPTWPMRNMIKLIDKIEQKCPNNYHYVVSYRTEDQDSLLAFKNEINKKKYKTLSEKVFYFDALTYGLRYFIEVLSQADLFVGHNTGAYYMANALGLKTLGLYLPIKSLSAFRWAPFHFDSSRSKVVVPEVVCGEVEICVGDKCPYYECMARIEVDSIFLEVNEHIKSKKG
ncbi:MAG: glycosyltransferase family 9 protein [Bacteriovoracaceae bacterium]|nr:glycosyltransferase family 9 protein [Bacteriovoracaceae bacterium]